MKSSLKIVPAAAALLSLAGLAGCASGHPVGVAAPVPMALVAAQPVDYGVVLKSIALAPSDFKSGYTLKLMPGGDQLKDPTMGSCDYHYASETKRIARRQYVVYQGKTPGGISDEVVAYDSAAHAMAALTEFRTAIKHCVKEGDVAVTVLATHSNDPALPITDSETTAFRGTEPNGQHDYEAIVIQVCDRYLDALYIEDAQPFTAQESQAALALAITTGMRLSKQG